MSFIAMLRVKNEERWLDCVLWSLKFCERIFVMDDSSTDTTREIVEATPRATLIRSPFQGLNELRDKNWLLSQVTQALDPSLVDSGCYFVLNPDGDEQLGPGSRSKLLELEQRQDVDAASFRWKFLWNSPDQVRTDGIYGTLRKPIMFRLRPGLSFRSFCAGGTTHVPCVPSIYESVAYPLGADLLHYGYLHRADRVRKYLWYNQVDPHNAAEDCYRHMVQGDGETAGGGAYGAIDFPERTQWLLHAGPLRLEKL